jgi:general secretion pathway protein K
MRDEATVAQSSEKQGARRGGRHQKGFALLLVLSALGLMAVVAASFTQIARTNVKLAAVAGEGARAEALADAGVQMVILDLVGARASQPSERRFPLDATPVSCGPGEGAVLTLAVQDEAGKVDINIAGPQLLRALVLGLGLSAGEAAVDAILDYRDEDDNRRLSGAERSEYLAAGRPHGPRNGPFLAVEELSGVLGLTQVDADLMRPFVTIYSGLAAIDANVAPEALVALLAKGLAEGGGLGLLDRDSGSGLGDLSMGSRGGRLPPQLLGASTRRAFSVRSQARTTAGAVFVREAVIEFVATGASAYLLRRWHRGSAVLSGPPPLADTLPPC